jgi:hypothetical protein
MRYDISVEPPLVDHTISISVDVKIQLSARKQQSFQGFKADQIFIDYVRLLCWQNKFQVAICDATSDKAPQ